MTLQLQHVRQFAPNSLHALYRHEDTGSPHYDYFRHLERYSNRQDGNASRIYLEDTSLIGDGLIVHIEHDLTPANDKDGEARILSVPYAEARLGSLADATEFIRSVKLIAGEAARARELQQIASHYYEQIKERASSYSSNAAESSPVSTQSEAVRYVLKEMGLLAMFLSAETSTEEEHLFEEPIETTLASSAQVAAEPLSLSERRRLFEERVEVLTGSRTCGDLHRDELNYIKTRLTRHTSSAEHDEFRDYLNEELSAIDIEADADGHEEQAIMSTYERAYEQYDENHVVSLHMSDGEMVVVMGSLDDDIDESYLPVEAQALHDILLSQYVSGADEEELDATISFELGRLYGELTLRTTRTTLCRFLPTAAPSVHDRKATNRRGGRSSIVEFSGRTKVNQEAEVRSYVREVLEKIIDGWSRDFHLRAMNRNPLYRNLFNRLIAAGEVTTLTSIIKEAYTAKKEGQISLRLFTWLNAKYDARRATLEQARLSPLAYRMVRGSSRLQWKHMARFAQALHTLPRQERDRVRAAFAENNPRLYDAVLANLFATVERANERTLKYLRFAFYEDRAGKCNVTDSLIHTLTSMDKARVWETLKSRSTVSRTAVA